MKIVVALGGNAIADPATRGDIDQQFARSRITALRLADVLDRGHELVICHGNGPQVGNILRRVELARGEVYPIPLVLCVADTQAGMGYMIGQCLMNELRVRGRPRLVTTLVTTVLVDPADPALTKPTKPIGILYTEEQARRHERDDGWQLAPQGEGRFRRVVASPRPQAIVELPAIEALLASGHILVACGGGGIPVRETAASEGAPALYAGVEGVIDKDLTAALLARALGADRLVIATAVERVYESFGTPAARPLDALTVAEARALLARGDCPAGSMGPKVEAAADFVERAARPDAEAVICSLDRLADAVDGRSGTRVRRG